MNLRCSGRRRSRVRGFAVRCVGVRVLVLVSALAAVSGVGCTWLVPFDTVSGSACEGGACLDAALAPDVTVDQGGDSPDASDAPGADSGTCTGKADGVPCGTGDSCHATPICMAGVCAPQQKADNTPCATALDACHSVPTCKSGVCGPSTALPEGTQWQPGNDNARCCSSKPIQTTTNTDCGVCGVACSTDKGQSCGLLSGHYFCLGCATDPDCWSGCCSLTNGAHCSPSDCNTGACHVPDLCPDMSHCQMDVVNYCSY
jgi:hypothetical protein